MGGFDVDFQVGVAQFLQMPHGGAEIVVPAFKAGAGAMEKLGRHGEKSLARESLGDVANMRVDAKGFLHHQKTARWRRARRARHVQPHGRAVTYVDRDKFAANLHRRPPQDFCGTLACLGFPRGLSAGRQELHTPDALV